MKTFLAEIFYLFGQIDFSLLLCNFGCYLFYCGDKVVHYSLGDLSLHVDDIFLVDEGFVLLSLKLVRNFLQLMVISSCFMLFLS